MFDYEEAHYVYLTSWWKKGLIDKSEEKTRQSKKELLLCCLLCKKMPHVSIVPKKNWNLAIRGSFRKTWFWNFFFSWYFIPRAKFANFHNFFSSHIKPEIIKLCLSLVSSMYLLLLMFLSLFSVNFKNCHIGHTGHRHLKMKWLLNEKQFLSVTQPFSCMYYHFTFYQTFFFCCYQFRLKKGVPQKKVKLKGHKCLPKAKRKAN